ncbi:hypothetical protein ACKKBG_A07975 [Auxenochlorella protothecoides x Auxenochlorella symbiontica]
MSSSPFEAAASPGGRVVIPAPAVTPPPFPSEVREPLLTPRISSYRSQSMQPPSSWEAGTHMVKSILGVALLALPRVFSMLGIGAGSICLAAVALLAYASLHALAKASARTGVMNMSVLAREELGVTGQAVLDMALIFNCFGMLVVYLVVIGDMLVGSPGEPGILTQDCGSRRVVLAVVAVVLLAPLVSSTSTQSRSLAGASALGVAAILLWAAVSLILFIIAANNGALSHMHWWPKGHALIGHGFKSAVELTSLLSIMLVAYTCHWTLQHSMQSASSVRERQAQGVSAGAIAASTATFLLISICSYGVFGNATSADVINNYSVETLSKLLIPELAQAGFFGIRLGVLIALLLSFPLHASGREGMRVAKDTFLKSPVNLHSPQSMEMEYSAVVLINLTKPHTADGAPADLPVAARLPPAPARTWPVPGNLCDPRRGMARGGPPQRHLECLDPHRIDCRRAHLPDPARPALHRHGGDPDRDPGLQDPPPGWRPGADPLRHWHWGSRHPAPRHVRRQNPPLLRQTCAPEMLAIHIHDERHCPP